MKNLHSEAQKQTVRTNCALTLLLSAASLCAVAALATYSSGGKFKKKMFLNQEKYSWDKRDFWCDLTFYFLVPR